MKVVTIVTCWCCNNDISVRLVGDATVATVRDHCETVVEVLLGGDLRPVDTRQAKLSTSQLIRYYSFIMD
jgi:hypothetical protein